MKLSEGDLNKLLMKQGTRVFKSLEGYGSAKWARRIGAAGKEVDFVIINPAKPRVGVVECGLKLSGDLEQLRHYARWLASSSPETVATSIAASTTGQPKSGVQDRKRANLDSPLRRKRPGQVIQELSGLIGKAQESGRLDAILLIFLQRRPSSKRSLRRLFDCELPAEFGNRKDGVRWRLVIVEVM